MQINLPYLDAEVEQALDLLVTLVIPYATAHRHRRIKPNNALAVRIALRVIARLSDEIQSYNGIKALESCESEGDIADRLVSMLTKRKQSIALK